MLMWLLDSLSLRDDDTVFIAVSAAIDQEFNLSGQLTKEYPNITFQTVHLHFMTRGAAETLYCVMQAMDDVQSARKTISLDCDTFYFSNILDSFRTLDKGVGTCFYFNVPEGTPPIYSYIALDNKRKITDIAEKVGISDCANTGGYGFASGDLLTKYLAIALDEGVPSSGEYYTSSIIKRMISDGCEFRGLKAVDFACVGTRPQLAEFFKTLKKRPYLVMKRRFCFDLDNTLVTYPTERSNYTTVKPIEKNINLVRDLKDLGHTIIISTARSMRSCQGNIGKVMAKSAKVTLQTLEDFNIPYDELVFGKPYAHVYIDDLAVHSALDTEKEIGWGLGSDRRRAEKVDFIAPRTFNSIQFNDEVVIKSSNASAIFGELFFYLNMPKDIKHLFPRLISHQTVPGANNSKSVTMSLEHVKGITLTRLFTSRCLTAGRLHSFLLSLRKIHSSTGPERASNGEKIDMYRNYARKVRTRYLDNAKLYESVGIHDDMFSQITDDLEAYEREDRGMKVAVVHGDPVFTNILSLPTGEFRFIDMRGMQGSTMTLQGDATYDLGKIYQSLCGYDFILQDIEFTHRDEETEEELKKAFKQSLKELYPEVAYADVVLVATSLYASLIPLHDNYKHQTLFANHARMLFKEHERIHAPAEDLSYM